MNHKRLSGYLIAAGSLAGAGGIYLFYIHEPLQLFRLLGGFSSSKCVLSVAGIALIGLIYIIALVNYFKVCLNIGRNSSFCTANSHYLKRIGSMLWCAGCCWLLAIFILALLGMRLLFPYLVLGFAALASFCVGVVAFVLSQLVDRASRLQEENDLTI